MTAYYDFSKTHWKHLRTTNIIESTFDLRRGPLSDQRLQAAAHCGLFHVTWSGRSWSVARLTGVALTATRFSIKCIAR